MTYTKLDEQLSGRSAQRRKLANNTYAERRGSDAIAIRLHSTDILTFKKSGEVIANSGGWKTVTTKARLNEYLPSGFLISQARGIWSWNTGAVFSDGDSISAKGALKTSAKTSETSKQLKFRKRVLAYAKVCADALPLNEPSSADCWHCAMVTTAGQALGDAFKNASHLESHMAEGYVVPSLVFHAMKEKGWTEEKIPFAAAFGRAEFMLDVARREVKSAVARYIFRRFGMASK